MRYEIKKTKSFNPVSVTLTFETERELKKFTQLVGNLADSEICEIANRDKDDFDFEAITDFESNEDAILGLQLFMALNHQLS